MDKKADEPHPCEGDEGELFITEYKKLAEAVERDALEGMEDFPEDPEDEERRFRAIMERVGEEAEEDVHKEDPTPEMTQRDGTPRIRSLWASAGKWAAIVVVVLGSVFAMSMTSEANRSYFLDSVSYLMGKDARVKVNTDDGNLVYNMSETEARSVIEEALGIEVPMLKYKPQGMSFVGYELYTVNMYAIIHYEINNNKVPLYMSAGDKKKAGTGVFEGKPTEKIPFAYDTVMADFYEEPNGLGESPTLGAQWEYANAFYQLSGNMEREKFIKIIEKITF